MKKKLILLSAPPASGKNYVSQRLCKRLGNVAYLDKDDLCPLVGRLFDITENPRNMDGDFYKKNVRDAEYGTLFRLALASVKFNDLTLINAPLGREMRSPDFMKNLRKELSALDAQLYVVWLVSTPELCRERMTKRNAPRDAWKLADWESYVKNINYAPPFELKEQDAVDELICFDTTSEENFAKSFENTIKKLSE